MTRRPREDRSSLASRHLGLRLTEDEYELMMKCVDAKNSLMKEVGLPALMTATAFVKLLIHQEAERSGLAPQRSSLHEEEELSETAAVDELATAARQASPRRAPLARRLPPAGASGASRAVPPMDAEVAKRVLATAAGDKPKRPVPRPGSTRRRKRA